MILCMSLKGFVTGWSSSYRMCWTTSRVSGILAFIWQLSINVILQLNCNERKSCFEFFIPRLDPKDLPQIYLCRLICVPIHWCRDSVPYISWVISPWKQSSFNRKLLVDREHIIVLSISHTAMQMQSPVCMHCNSVDELWETFN